MTGSLIYGICTSLVKKSIKKILRIAQKKDSIFCVKTEKGGAFYVWIAYEKKITTIRENFLVYIAPTGDDCEVIYVRYGDGSILPLFYRAHGFDQSVGQWKMVDFERLSNIDQDDVLCKLLPFTGPIEMVG